MEYGSAWHFDGMPRIWVRKTRLGFSCQRTPFALDTKIQLPHGSKQFFYSIKVSKINKSFISQKKITKFLAQKFLQGKNKNRTKVGHIKELLGHFIGSCHFIRRSAFLNLFAGWGVLEPQCSMELPFHYPILNSSVLLEVSWKNNLRKPLVNAEIFEFVIKRQSANHSWRHSIIGKWMRAIGFVSVLYHSIHITNKV